MAIKPTYEELKKRVKALEKANRAYAGKAKTLYSELEERVRFESLLADVSAVFVNIPVEQVDGKIEGVLSRVGQILELDRITFIEFLKESGGPRITHSWAIDGIEPQPHMFTAKRYPWLAEKTMRGEAFFFSSPEELPVKAEQDKKYLKRTGVKSGLVIPYFTDNSLLYSVAFGTVRSSRSWPEDLVHRLRVLGEVFSNAILRKQADIELHKAFSEIQELKDRLVEENVILKQEIKAIKTHPEIIGESAPIKKVLTKIEQVAGTNSTVLILGETGTGKELVARAVHTLSSRKANTMVTVNCAALPATLVESELFGREKGAYTGALSKQVGRFEIADGSTIFLDEIGELPLETQVKLLRVLQEGRFERLGSSKTVQVDVRVIAATNRDLEKAIQEGRFREDLYYRLHVFPIRVPPLRDRADDILHLTWAFVKEFGDAMGKRIDTIPKKSLEAMQRYAWPGNIRELRNVIERAMIASRGRTLAMELPELSSIKTPQDLTLEELERGHILAVLEKTHWRIRGRDGAAEVLGLKPSTLYARMKRLEIQRPKNPSIF